MEKRARQVSLELSGPVAVTRDSGEEDQWWLMVLASAWPSLEFRLVSNSDVRRMYKIRMDIVDGNGAGSSHSSSRSRRNNNKRNRNQVEIVEMVRKKAVGLESKPKLKSTTTKRNRQPRRLLTKRVTAFPKAPRTRREMAVLPAAQDGDMTSSSSAQIRKLHEAVTLLQQIHVRNKNQHRGQEWFKQLGITRRALISLLRISTELEELVSGPLENGSRCLKADDVRAGFEQEAKLRAEKQRLEEWVREVLVPQAYVRFSVLVADNQFAQIGLVLVGVLGDVAAVVGVPRRVVVEERPEGVGARERGKHDVREVVGRRTVVTGRGRGVMEEERFELGVEAGGIVAEKGMEMDPAVDTGEVVERRAPVPSSGASKDADDVGVTIHREGELDLDATEAEDEEQDKVSAAVTGTGRFKVPKRKELLPKTEMSGAATRGEKARSIPEGDAVKRKPRKNRKDAIDDIFAWF